MGDNQLVAPKGFGVAASTARRPHSLPAEGTIVFVTGVVRALSLPDISTAVNVTDSTPLVAGTVRRSRRSRPPLIDDAGSVTTVSGPSSTRQ